MAARDILIVSDVEMGPGGLVDDFPHDALLAQIITAHAKRQDDDTCLDLVFNGDTLDFLRTPIDAAFPTHITAEVARRKLERIVSAHDDVFSALRAFTKRANCRVHFIVGNHDPELLFPEVQSRLAEACGAAERVRFPGFDVQFGPVHIEHGSQYDNMFAMEPDRPFVGDPDHPILNLSWGGLALMNIWGALKQELFVLDRIRPRDRLFRLLPEVKTLMLRRSWRYWSRDFWRDFSADPLKHVTWPMIKEVAYRFMTADAEVDVRKQLETAVKHSPARLFIVGHVHRASRRSFGGKTLITSGCLRNEYVVSDDGRLKPAGKGAVRVRLDDDRIVATEMLRFDPPEPPAGQMPSNVEALRAPVQRQLELLSEPVPSEE